MHDIYESYPGVRREDDYCFFDREGLRMSQHSERHYVLTGEMPPDLDPLLVRQARFWESMPEAQLRSLPPYVKEFKNLEYLFVPSYCIENLQTEDLPSNLKVLTVFGTDVRFPKELVCQSLEWLYTTMSETEFSPTNFPMLKYIGVKLDRRGKVVARLHDLPSLRAVNTHPINNISTLNTLQGCSIEHLRLGGGRATSLREIDRHRNLRSLWLQDFSYLEDISALEELGRIEDLTIIHCKPIGDLSALNRMSSLRQVRILNSGALTQALRVELERKGVLIHERYVQ